MIPLLILAATLLGASVITRGLAAKRTGEPVSTIIVIDLAFAAAATGLVAMGAESMLAQILAPLLLVYVVGGIAHRAVELRRRRQIRDLSEGRRLETFLHVNSPEAGGEMSPGDPPSAG